MTKAMSDDAMLPIAILLGRGEALTVAAMLDAAGIKAPDVLDGVPQKPIDGISFRYSFAHPSAPSQRRTQIYEMMENFGIYHDGWLAGTLPKRGAWEAGAAGNRRLTPCAANCGARAPFSEGGETGPRHLGSRSTSRRALRLPRPGRRDHATTKNEGSQACHR